MFQEPWFPPKVNLQAMIHEKAKMVDSNGLFFPLGTLRIWWLNMFVNCRFTWLLVLVILCITWQFVTAAERKGIHRGWRLKRLWGSRLVVIVWRNFLGKQEKLSVCCCKSKYSSELWVEIGADQLQGIPGKIEKWNQNEQMQKGSHVVG